MKGLFEGMKDFFYDAIDYILIIVIVLVVSGIIGWRLDILFAKDVEKEPLEYEMSEQVNNEEAEDNINSEKESNKDDIIEEDVNEETAHEENKNDNNENDSDLEDEQTASNEDKTDIEESTYTEINRIITVNIPSGSLPNTIANILYENGVIKDKKEFLLRAQELKLDTKLQAGKYRIEQNTSLDSVIKIIAGIS